MNRANRLFTLAAALIAATIGMFAVSPTMRAHAQALAGQYLTNGQVLIGSTGAGPVAATITGTAGQLTVTNGAGTITLSINGLTPQTTTALSLRTDTIGTKFLVQENNSVSGAAVTNAFNECVATAAAVASYVYLNVSTNTPTAAAGAACAK